MVGAFLAGRSCPGRRVGVIEDKEVRPADFGSIVADLRFREALLEVRNWHEEYSFVCDNRSSLLSQVSCPQFGAVRIGSFVLFFSPRVSYLEEFDRLAFCVFEFVGAQDGKGVAD